MTTPFILKKRNRTPQFVVALVLWLSALAPAALPYFQGFLVAAHVEPWPDDLKKPPESLKNTLYFDSQRKMIQYRFLSDYPFDHLEFADTEVKEMRALSARPQFQNAIGKLVTQTSWHLGYYLCYLWLVVVVLFELGTWIWRGKQRYLDKNFDFRLAGLFVVASAGLIYGLAANSFLSTGGPMESPDDGGFWHAHGEFFVSLGFLVGVVGAVFAVYAKKKADQVFEISSEIHNNLTSFFTTFDTVVDKNQGRSVPALIERARKELIFFMGPPLMGYFRDPAIGTDFQNWIAEKASDHKGSKLRIEYVCWSESRCKPFVDKLGDDEKKGDFIAAQRLLFKSIKGLGGRGRVFNYSDGQDPMIRFVIADGQEAIFWVIDDYTTKGVDSDRKIKEEYGAYPGGGFTTDSAGMIQLLKNIYENVPKVPVPTPGHAAAE